MPAPVPACSELLGRWKVAGPGSYALVQKLASPLTDLVLLECPDLRLVELALVGVGVLSGGSRE